MSAVVTLEHVCVKRGSDVVLEEIGFAVEPGQFVGICGPNGAGKTTLLRAILGLLPIASGEIRGARREAGRACDVARQIGYVPQRQAIAGVIPGARARRRADGTARGRLRAACERGGSRRGERGARAGRHRRARAAPDRRSSRAASSAA